MKIANRRLTFQLTPLLDLLLIVIFAQYMEVQQTAAETAADVQEERETLVENQAKLQSVLEAREAELESQYARRQAELDEQRQEYDRHFQSVLDQHQQAGETLAKAFNLPGELLEQLLKVRTSGDAADAERMKAAAERVSKLLSTRGSQFIEFVVRLDEMQKHVSVWEIHLQQNGKALLTDGEHQFTLDFDSAEQFVTSVFQASKTFTEPRTLVIVLLTYGDTQFGPRRQATDAMPQLMEQLRSDAGGTHWYDFSLMGYRPQGPVFSGQPQPAAP
jgi:hypothetical protein